MFECILFACFKEETIMLRPDWFEKKQQAPQSYASPFTEEAYGQGSSWESPWVREQLTLISLFGAMPTVQKAQN